MGSDARLAGRTVVVLGAGQNMGLAAARAAARSGAAVVCVDVDAGLAEAAAKAIDAVPMTADVTSRSDLERVFGDVAARWGVVDGIVDVVGMARWEPLLESTDESWHEQFSVCLTHAMLTLKIAPPLMGPGGGAIAFVSSVSGLRAAPGHAAYGAAKAALTSLVKSASIELAPRRIRVNAVTPGLVATDRFRTLFVKDPDAMRALEEGVPLGRLGTSEDVAAALMFLLSDESSYITGQSLVLDGGLNHKLAFSRPVPGRPSA